MKCVLPTFLYMVDLVLLAGTALAAQSCRRFRIALYARSGTPQRITATFIHTLPAPFTAVLIISILFVLFSSILLFNYFTKYFVFIVALPPVLAASSRRSRRTSKGKAPKKYEVPIAEPRARDPKKGNINSAYNNNANGGMVKKELKDPNQLPTWFECEFDCGYERKDIRMVEQHVSSAPIFPHPMPAIIASLPRALMPLPCFFCTPEVYCDNICKYPPPLPLYVSWCHHPSTEAWQHVSISRCGVSSRRARMTS